MPRAPDWRTGAKLPGLRRWRLRRELTQTELAQMAGVNQSYLTRIETGRRGCNPSVVQKLAEILDVDVQELTTAPGKAAAGSGETTTRPAAASQGSAPYLHRAYLRYILAREVGTSYTALWEGELKRRCEALSWEGVLEVVYARRRELEFLEKALEDPDLPPEVRLFFEEVVREAPDQDIGVLIATRGREISEKGRERLTQAMRELL
jgi:transcriptional regulator with XRE-family HTH domain